MRSSLALLLFCGMGWMASSIADETYDIGADLEVIDSDSSMHIKINSLDISREIRGKIPREGAWQDEFTLSDDFKTFSLTCSQDECAINVGASLRPVDFTAPWTHEGTGEPNLELYRGELYKLDATHRLNMTIKGTTHVVTLSFDEQRVRVTANPVQ